MNKAWGFRREYFYRFTPVKLKEEKRKREGNR